MPIQAKCPQCERLLQVDDQFAGKEARCPVCNAVYRVPELAAVEIEAELAAEDHSSGPLTTLDSGRSESQPTAFVAEIMAEPVDVNEKSSWLMRTPEGQTFGPASWDSLKKWVAEGRVTADCELRPDEGSWQSADLIFTALRVPPPIQASMTPVSNGLAASAVRNSQRLAPHRGGLILTLAMVGFVSGCPILSIMAWVMGNGDLREMREGRMDPEGQGLTQAGYMLGMILSFVWIGAAVVGLFVVLIVAASGK